MARANGRTGRRLGARVIALDTITRLIHSARLLGLDLKRASDLRLASERHPLRIQRSRKAGSRLPAGAVCVTRPGKWGNPFSVEQMGRDAAVRAFRELIESDPQRIEAIRAELKGKQLACWCSIDTTCHADVLAEIANS